MTEGAELPGPVGMPDPGTAATGAAPASPGTESRSTTPPRPGILPQFERMIVAIRNGDDVLVESTIISISQRSRFLTPLTFVVGAFAMLFQGVKLLVTNWRLTLIQILPAMLIWLAMLDLKIHMLRGRSLHVIRGPVLIPTILALALLTAGAYYLNAVFAFSVSNSGKPEIRPAFTQARVHRFTILGWGFVIGLALGFATTVSARWGKGWFGLILGIVVAVMMVTYVAVPARLIGVKSDRSRRDKLTATAVGGALGAVVCSPPYVLGRIGIILLGNRTLFFLGVILLIVAIPLQTGAVTATKAVKFSAKLVTTEVAEVVGAGRSASTSKPVASATAVVEPADPGDPPDPPDRGT
jgi:uncharacterized membrane protein